LSFARAFAVATGGDTVSVASGSYTGQSLSGTAKASPVGFVAATPGAVQVASLNISVDRVHFSGIVASGSGDTRGDLSVCSSACATAFTDVFVDGFRGRSAFLRNSGITVDHSEFGGFSACTATSPEDAFRFWAGTGVTTTPTNDKLLHSTIHDVDSGSGFTCQGTTHAGFHVDCMQNAGGQNIQIAGNTFYNCPTSDIQMQPFAGATLGNVTLENNWFGSTACCNSIVLGVTTAGGDCSTLAIRNNVLFSVPNAGSCATGASGLQVYGNIFQRVVASCGGGTFAFNVFAPGGSTCGSNAKLCTVIFAQPVPGFGGGKPDGHLASSDTCAKDAADPVRFPAVDADGDPRPVGAAPDAGMDELAGAVPPPADTTPPAVSLTAPADGATVSGTVTITADASDNVGVSGVSFKVDGVLVGADDTASPYSVSWASGSVANGSHTLSAVARDAAGNSATSTTVSVTVNNAPAPDTTPPLVSVTAPAAGATVSGQTTITANASDNVGVVGVTFMVDGLTIGSEVTVAPYSLAWDSASVPDGSHTVTALARDAAGNTASSAGVAVTVSNAPPPQTVTNLTRPTISGSATVGNTLVLSTGTWNGSPTSFVYGWQRCNQDGTGCVRIAGATSASYRIQSTDRGKKLRGMVTASSNSSSASAFSDLTATVRRPN
jgi:hypothetical protein